MRRFCMLFAFPWSCFMLAAVPHEAAKSLVLKNATSFLIKKKKKELKRKKNSER